MQTGITEPYHIDVVPEGAGLRIHVVAGLRTEIDAVFPTSIAVALADHIRAVGFHLDTEYRDTEYAHAWYGESHFEPIETD